MLCSRLTNHGAEALFEEVRSPEVGSSGKTAQMALTSRKKQNVRRRLAQRRLGSQPLKIELDISSLVKNWMASLILAQDERWRRA